MKKTTVYFDDNEYKRLRGKAFLEEVSVAELIRRGVKLVCDQTSPETQKAMIALNRIRKQVAETGASEKDITRDILEAQKFVRKNKKR